MEPVTRHPETSGYSPRGSRNMRPTLIIVGLFLLFVVIIGGVLYQRMHSHPMGKFSFTAPVTTAAVKITNLPEYYETVGTLEANMQVDIRPETLGIVKDILFKEGQWVDKGTPLIQLEYGKQAAGLMETQSSTAQAEASLASLQADYQAKLQALQAAKAERDWANSEYNRYKSLGEKEFVSPSQVEDKKTQLQVRIAAEGAAQKLSDSALARLKEAQASIDVAKARYQHSKETYADTIIRAPFSGQLGQKTINIGDYVSPVGKMVTLVQSNPLKIAFGVPERYLNKLKNGLPVEIHPENEPNKNISGTLIFVDPVVSPETRSILVKARIENAPKQLEPGQYTHARLIFGEKENAMVVPEESLIPQGEKYFVYVVDNGKAAFRQVETGLRIPGFVEILSGITANDRVITGGIQKVQDGVPVKELPAMPDPGQKQAFPQKGSK